MEDPRKCYKVEYLKMLGEMPINVGDGGKYIIYIGNGIGFTMLKLINGDNMPFMWGFHGAKYWHNYSWNTCEYNPTIWCN